MYQSLQAIAEAIAAKIEATKKFRQVTYAACANAGQLFEMLEAQTQLPAAVVCIGDADYADDALSRTIRPLVIVADRFQRGQAGRAGGVWDLVEAVEQLYLPSFVAETDPSFPADAGIEFVVRAWAPIDGTRALAAYSLTLEGVEAL